MRNEVHAFGRICHSTVFTEGHGGRSGCNAENKYVITFALHTYCINTMIIAKASLHIFQVPVSHSKKSLQVRDEDPSSLGNNLTTPTHIPT